MVRLLVLLAAALALAGCAAAPARQLHEEAVEREPGSEEHGGEHEHEHGPPDANTFMIAGMLMGFLVLDMVILYLVNWKDPNVRSYMYCMISTTLSIFCAVLLNHTFNSFVVDQVIKGKPPRGLGFPHAGTLGHVLVGALGFTCSFAMLHVLCYVLRESKYLAAIEEIGAHLTAFAGITFFRGFQCIKSGELLGHIDGFLMAVAFLGLYHKLALRARSKFCGEDSDEHSIEGDDSDEDREVAKGESWTVVVSHSERDVAAIILSNLVMHLVVFLISGEHPAPWEHHPQAEAHSKTEVYRLLMATFAFLLLIVVCTFFCVRRWPERLDAINTFLAMCMGWCIQMAVHWIMAPLAHTVETAEIYAAGVVTAFAVVLIIVLDMIADRFQNPHQHAQSQVAQPDSVDSDSSGSDLHALAASGLQVALDFAPTTQKTAMERVLRVIISSLGLLVGFCWEKALHSADTTILNSFSFSRHHHVWGQVLMAVCTAILVIPAWVKHVLPMARMHWREHEAMIALEQAGQGTGKAHVQQMLLKAMENFNSRDYVDHVIDGANRRSQDERQLLRTGLTQLISDHEARQQLRSARQAL